MGNSEHTFFIVVFSVIPGLATILGLYLALTGAVSNLDLALFAAMYVVAGLGVSTGYHRLLSHRSFQVSRPLRLGFTLAGAIAGQGPPLTWVAHHRRHHRVADKTGDPHSPYVTARGDEVGRLRGLWHAHLGWLLNSKLTSDPIRYCPDLCREREMRIVSRYFVPIVLAGIIAPGLVAFVITGSGVALLSGILWGGLIRMFVANNITYAVNSIGHVIGSRRYETPDESRNVALLSVLSFGESWHNNHHAFPRSATHGLEWYQIDISALVIKGLATIGLASDVVVFDREARDRVERTRWASGSGGRRMESAPAKPLAHLDAGGLTSAVDVE